ncbi:glycerol-3-phosphate dehydrogenase/oxidase [Nesterenkonia flava]|uniref:Glycerol-3-phosphate dehydrogenase/oxidase n=1 Tax=Nesterenkonia flava TaxID=469799 RepID=A0ABU1FVU7_9MICC|nr:glycerol-3-phosphate dehydrogenase/oxidase [Nesterenkonia flava]MDR5712798.1 glycerol-3-phosphate dehydrogenase/oxidase [Nesterenkonia flava]
MDHRSREAALARVAASTPENPLDVLVIGAGVVGSAAAFDAAGRGLDTALVEARDIAEGTSSRSSKLIHGGLRYLQMLDFKLVAEALRERDLLLTRLAPHLVRPLPFIFPFERQLVERAFIGSGVSLYDLLASGSSALRSSRRGASALRSLRSRAVPFHRHLGSKGLAERFPGLDQEKFHGGLEYYDAQVDDARLVLTLARSAHSLGAAVAPRTEVIGYLRQDPQEPERITGAVLRDHLTGRQIQAHARETILAAGVWTGAAQELIRGSAPEQLQDAQDSGRQGLTVLASKGIHVTVPKHAIAAQERVGIITQTEKSVLFIIPLEEVWAIGTTDTAWREAVESPAATAADIDYVLEHANAVLGSTLTREDIIGTWAGLRPLLQPVRGDTEAPTKVSREHTVMELAPGLTGVAGGKLTTYRVMAQDVVDFAVNGSFKDRASLTEVMPLLGAVGYGEWTARAEEIAAAHGWDRGRVERLLHRYGSLTGEVLDLIADDDSLGRALEYAPSCLRAEIVYACTHEGALHVDDLLTRRTRLIHEVPDRGAAAAEEVAGLAAGVLGWDEERRRAEISAYRDFIHAQKQAEQLASDAEAAALIAAHPPVPQTADGGPLAAPHTPEASERRT